MRSLQTVLKEAISKPNAPKTMANTPENKAIVSAMIDVEKTGVDYWREGATHDTLDKCLTAINLMGKINSGWYKPVAVSVKGLTGLYMLNQDGSLNVYERVIKNSETSFIIQLMNAKGMNKYEEFYEKYID